MISTSQPWRPSLKKSAAIMGSLASIKPILGLISAEALVPIKVRGRKKAARGTELIKAGGGSCTW